VAKDVYFVSSLVENVDALLHAYKLLFLLDYMLCNVLRMLYQSTIQAFFLSTATAPNGSGIIVLLP